jgi:seryl-tRNA synthetase
MKGKSVVFIKIKWQNYLKSRESLRDYNQVKYELSKLKKKFKKKDQEIENEIRKMTEFQNLIKMGISECITEKERKISVYKEELNGIMSSIPKQIKDHELAGKYSKYNALLESTDIRESFFQQEVFWQDRLDDITKLIDLKFQLELLPLDKYF